MVTHDGLQWFVVYGYVCYFAGVNFQRHPTDSPEAQWLTAGDDSCCMVVHVFAPPELLVVQPDWRHVAIFSHTQPTFVFAFVVDSRLCQPVH